jgi:hypothetical protein
VQVIGAAVHELAHDVLVDPGHGAPYLVVSLVNRAMSPGMHD